MADLTLTAASVADQTGATVAQGRAGVAITAGQVVYLDSTTNTYKLADNDSATAAARSPSGIACNSAASGQQVSVVTSGQIALGAVLTAGVFYYLSATAGGICPVADLVTGKTVAVLGYAATTSILNVKIQATGVTL